MDDDNIAAEEDEEGELQIDESRMEEEQKQPEPETGNENSGPELSPAMLAKHAKELGLSGEQLMQ